MAEVEGFSSSGMPDGAKDADAMNVPYAYQPGSLRVAINVDLSHFFDNLMIVRSELLSVDELIRRSLRRNRPRRTGQMHDRMRRHRLRFVPAVEAPLGSKMTAKEARWTSRS